MGIRDTFLQLADISRSIQGPTQLDVTGDQLNIVSRAWSGGQRGSGTPTDTVLYSLLQQYRIKQLTTQDVASSGGNYETGDILIGPITPYFNMGGVTGGYTPAQLKPDGATGTEILYVLSGTHPGEYDLIEARTWARFSYYLVVRRRLTTF